MAALNRRLLCFFATGLYLQLLIQQQLHHQLLDLEHLAGHAEQSKQVVENHNLDVGEH